MKYVLPDFLAVGLTRETYIRWLQRKAQAHRKRDRNRGNETATVAEYKAAIHRAVLLSKGLDAYTGERLNWTQISQYNNDESKEFRREYKARFALLPTVDHVGDGLGAADFLICAWRTNDAKNDLSYDDFLALCQRVVTYAASSKA